MKLESGDGQLEKLEKGYTQITNRLGDDVEHSFSG